MSRRGVGSLRFAGERGSAMIELAVAVSFLAVLMSGIISLDRAMVDRAHMSEAARMAGRVGARCAHYTGCDTPEHVQDSIVAAAERILARYGWTRGKEFRVYIREVLLTDGNEPPMLGRPSWSNGRAVFRVAIERIGTPDFLSKFLRGCISSTFVFEPNNAKPSLTTVKPLGGASSICGVS